MRKDTKIHRCLMHLVESGCWVSPEGQVYNPRGKLVNGSVVKNKKGYARHVLGVRDPLSKTMYSIPTSKLVAILKFGEDSYLASDCVRHLNGDSLDNSYENIAIGSHSDNMMDIPKHARRAKALHAQSCKRHKINWEGVFTTLAYGLTTKEVARAYSSTEGSIRGKLSKSGIKTKNGKVCFA